MSARRLTSLGVMLLALLRESEMHPYEMMRLLRVRERDQMLRVTNGTLYHTVSRLESAGLLEEVGVDRDGNRPERTTYRLTAEGDDAMSEWVRDHLPRVDRGTEFRVALAEAHNLPREEVRSLLSTRRAALAERCAHAAAVVRAAAESQISAQYTIEIEREAHMRNADLSWLDTLIVRMSDPDFPWGPISACQASATPHQ